MRINQIFSYCLQINIRSTWLMFALFFGLAYVTASAETNTPQNLNLYLPINSENQQSLLAEIQDSLEKNSLTNIQIKFADHWHGYQQNLKNGRLGIYLAPPHFAAWAINKHSFKPLMRIAEPLSFVIAAKRAQPEIFELNDLLNRTVCTQSPLNLDYLVSIEAFKKLLGSSKNKFIRNVTEEMLAKQSDCFGFAVSNHVLQSLESQGNGDFIRLYQGQKYNNYVLIAHPTINSEFLTTLKQYFIHADTQELYKPIFNLFANETKLISSHQNDYPQSYYDNLSSHWQ